MYFLNKWNYNSYITHNIYYMLYSMTAKETRK